MSGSDVRHLKRAAFADQKRSYKLKTRFQNMGSNEPRNHHCVPKFFLRNFAADEYQLRINTLAKHGDRAVWGNRAIDSVGYEENFYVHLEDGEPVSVETEINHKVETPISQSDTWQKIANGRADLLEASDRGVLYALVRHLHTRTPHYQATIGELAAMAERSDAEMPFTSEEREMYAEMRSDPAFAKGFLNHMAVEQRWNESGAKGCLIAVYRSPIPLYSSTTPVHTASAPAHAAMDLRLPGTTPHQLLLTLNRTTIVSLVIGDFDGAFLNEKITDIQARWFNRQFVAQFAHFPYVRHLIAGRGDLIEDVCWSPYDLVRESALKIVFRRRDNQ